VEGECIGVFLPVEVKKYYKIRDPKKDSILSLWLSYMRNITPTSYYLPGGGRIRNY
jgi:hypothetical protein